MVFCGKPSKSCAACRQRKSRCDQATPACGQCKATGRDCPGYRNPVDLAFRDQTNDVVKRVRAIKANNNGGRVSHTASRSRPRRSSDESSSSSSTANSPTSIVEPSPRISLQDFAVSVFHRRYLLHEPGSWSIDLDFLPDIYRQASPRGMLTDIIAALGLIASPNAKHDQRFVTASLEKYTSAIHLTNEAISDPVRAASDEVLVTVMLITFFEFMTCANQDPMKTLSIHMFGAAKLMSLRGEGQFNTDAGRKAFIRVRNLIAIDCYHRVEAMPKGILELSLSTQSCLNDGERDTTNLFCLAANLLSTRDSFRKQTTDQATMVDRLLAADQALEIWHSHLGPEYDTCRIPTAANTSSGSNNTTYTDYYDIYESQLSARLMNSYRSIRILAHELIIKCNPIQTLEQELQQAASKAIINKFSAEICASVPYFLGFHNTTTTTTTTTTTSPSLSLPPSPKTDYDNKNNNKNNNNNSEVAIPLPSITTAYSILRPLSCAGDNANTPPEMRKWCAAQMRRVYELTGIKLATYMADNMEARTEITEWAEI